VTPPTVVCDGDDDAARVTEDAEVEISAPQQAQTDVDVSTATATTTDAVGDESLQVWIRDPVLFESDRQVLLTSWLDDRIINAAQHLLRKQHPHAHGLHDTVTLSSGTNTECRFVGYTVCA